MLFKILPDRVSLEGKGLTIPALPVLNGFILRAELELDGTNNGIIGDQVLFVAFMVPLLVCGTT